MSDKKEQNNQAKSRRQLLKATIAGTGAVVAGKSLPEQWSRPLVDSVVLPAHAQTSGATAGGGLLLSVAKLDDTFIDSFISKAHAQPSSVVTAELCFELLDNGKVSVRALVDVTDGCYHDIAYLTGTVKQNVTTPLSLQNGECWADNTSATVEVAFEGSNAAGLFIFNNDSIDESSSPFNFSDPACPITTIPTPCDRDFDGGC